MKLSILVQKQNQKIIMIGINAPCEGRKMAVKAFKSEIFPTQTTEGTRRPKEMIQRLPEILAQVKESKTFENLLNEISKIIYSLYRTKEITKKIYGNIQPANIGPQDVPRTSTSNDPSMSPKDLI